jgi:hypothetical protein
MAGVFGSELFAGKYVSQMPFAMVADDLYSPAIYIRYSFYSTFNLIVKAGPSAMRIKFIG